MLGARTNAKNGKMAMKLRTRHIFNHRFLHFEFETICDESTTTTSIAHSYINQFNAHKAHKKIQLMKKATT